MLMTSVPVLRILMKKIDETVSVHELLKNKFEVGEGVRIAKRPMGIKARFAPFPWLWPFLHFVNKDIKSITLSI